MRAFEEIQENHGGLLLMEAGWSTSVNSIIRGVTLYSNSSTQSPSVSQYRLNYDSERGAMNLLLKLMILVLFLLKVTFGLELSIRILTARGHSMFPETAAPIGRQYLCFNRGLRFRGIFVSTEELST